MSVSLFSSSPHEGPIEIPGILEFMLVEVDQVGNFIRVVDRKTENVENLGSMIWSTRLPENKVARYKLGAIIRDEDGDIRGKIVSTVKSMILDLDLTVNKKRLPIGEKLEYSIHNNGSVEVSYGFPPHRISYWENDEWIYAKWFHPLADSELHSLRSGKTSTYIVNLSTDSISNRYFKLLYPHLVNPVPLGNYRVSVGITEAEDQTSGAHKDISIRLSETFEITTEGSLEPEIILDKGEFRPGENFNYALVNRGAAELTFTKDPDPHVIQMPQTIEYWNMKEWVKPYWLEESDKENLRVPINYSYKGPHYYNTGFDNYNHNIDLSEFRPGKYRLKIENVYALGTNVSTTVMKEFNVEPKNSLFSRLLIILGLIIVGSGIFVIIFKSRNKTNL